MDERSSRAFDPRLSRLPPAYLNPFFLLVLLLSLTRFLHLSSGELQDWDEAMYCWRAKVCVIEGAWLDQHPHSVGGFYSGAFPPLYVWATAALYKVLGFTEFASPFWAAAAGAGCVMLTWLLGRQIAGSWGGFLAAFFLSAIPYFCRYSRFGQFDIPYIFLVLLTIHLALQAHRRAAPIYWVGAGIALGLGLMTKIAVALMAPAVLGFFALWRLATRDTTWRALFAEQGIILLVGAAVAFPWHFLMWLRNGATFIEWTVGYHLLGKSGEVQDGNMGGPLFYVVELVGRVPAIIWLLALFAGTVGVCGMVGALVKARRSEGVGAESRSGGAAEKPARPSALAAIRAELTEPFAGCQVNRFALPLIWLALLLLVFSAAGTKRSTYALPMLPPLCLLAAVLIGRSIRERRDSPQPNRGAFVAVVAAVGLAAFSDEARDALEAMAAGRYRFIELLGVFALAGVAVSVALVLSDGLYRLARRAFRQDGPFRWLTLSVVMLSLVGIGYSEGLRRCLKPMKGRQSEGWRALAPWLDRRDYDALIGVGELSSNRATYYLNGANHGWAEGVRFVSIRSLDDPERLEEAVRAAVGKAMDAGDAVDERVIVVARLEGNIPAVKRLAEAVSRGAGLSELVAKRKLRLFGSAQDPN